jgi:hypothetical protein
MIKVFLYGSFTALFFIVSTGLEKFIKQYLSNYEFPITSTLILLFLLFTKGEYKKRTAYYLVPFSTIGIVFTLSIYPYGWIPYLVTLVYTFGTVYYLHKIKWDVFTIVPLFLAFIATVEYTYLGFVIKVFF